MALTKTRQGDNEDGTPHWHYEFDGSEDGMEGVLRTGPVSGSIQLKDGTAYNVSDDLIEHKPGHAGLICHHIAKMHEKSGRLAEFQKGDPIHTCTPECGVEAE